MAVAPQLPPRTYPRSPLALYAAPAVPRPVPSYERYRVLLAFFRRLSFTLTLAGSGTAVLVYLWRRYFLPKWVETNAARSKIAIYQYQAYDALVPRLREAARRGGGLALKVEASPEEGDADDGKAEDGADAANKTDGKQPALIEGPQDDEEEEILDLSEPLPSAERKQIEAGPSTTTAAEAQDTSSQSAEAASPTTNQPPRSPRPTPLDLSALANVDEYAKKPAQLANKNSLPASSKAASALLTSLSGFNADISTQAFLAGSERVRPAFPLGSSSASSTTTQQQKGGSDLAQLKAEIRSLKGVLLSRRNFGYARPTTSVQ
ncbi:hypothetical protein OC842_003667 [Tilletia horrida]|uniref:Peroxin-14 n=1 Tax=Tilletia horrida TaxID=155126 RepID=A0AAN6JK88_9BASI|nr:hypothetical protein OC842_003667 [Tilletia horrida]KAK0559641.1 hypothetical protein OC844_004270 [Tilletia horrida]